MPNLEPAIDPSFTYIAPTKCGRSFKVGKANVPFSRLGYLGIDRFDLPRFVCLRVASPDRAYQLETLVKHFFQRRSPRPAPSPFLRRAPNVEWFNASLFPALDECLEDCSKVVEFERIDNYFQEHASLASTPGLAGLRYEATATRNALRRDRDAADELASVLRALFKVSYRGIVLAHAGGGELTEIQFLSVARDEAKQRMSELETVLKKLTRSHVAKRDILKIHPLSASVDETRLHLQFGFSIAPLSPPPSEANRAIEDIYAEPINIIRASASGWSQPTMQVLKELGIKPGRRALNIGTP